MPECLNSRDAYPHTYLFISVNYPGLTRKCTEFFAHFMQLRKLGRTSTARARERYVADVAVQGP